MGTKPSLGSDGNTGVINRGDVGIEGGGGAEQLADNLQAWWWGWWGHLHDAIWRAAQGTQVNTILHVVLFQLGQDVFSIRVLPQGGNVRPDLQTQTVNRTQEHWNPGGFTAPPPGRKQWVETQKRVVHQVGQKPLTNASVITRSWE